MGKRKPVKKVTQGAKLKEALRKVKFFENKCAHCDKPVVKDEFSEPYRELCESCREEERLQELIRCAQTVSPLIAIAQKAILSASRWDIRGKTFSLEGKMRAISASITELEEKLLDIESGRLI